ncbi:oligosaccharide repeat unit polymerase [Eubacteriales bacterium OttesenSCG-928-A19]|nr:oligosaccharide repeat unit polymerase [Eubacteriales bacterium OttesenSCG-928-A19]
MVAIEIVVFTVICLMMGWRIVKDKLKIQISAYLLFMVFLMSSLYSTIVYTMQDNSISFSPFAAVMVAMAAFSLSYHITYIKKVPNPVFERVDSHVAIPAQFPIYPYKRLVRGMCAFCAILLLIGTYRYRGLPPIAESLTALLEGTLGTSSVTTLRENRFMLTKSHYFGGEYSGQGITKVLQNAGWPLLISLAVLILLEYKKPRDVFRVMLLGILALLYVAGDGTRAGVVIVLMSCVIAITKYKKMNLTGLIKYGLIFLLLMILLSSVSSKQYYLFSDGLGLETLLDSVKHIIDRAIMGNSTNDIIAIEYVQDGLLDFQYGSLHLTQFLNALPGASSYKNFSYMLGQMMGAGNTTYASTTYLAIAFVDFGYLGVFSLYFVLGLLLSAFQRRMDRQDANDLLSRAYIAAMTWKFGYLAYTGPISGMVDIVAVFFLYRILRYLCGNLRYLRRSNYIGAPIRR